MGRQGWKKKKTKLMKKMIKFDAKRASKQRRKG